MINILYRKFVLNIINGNNNDNLDSINDLVAVHVTPIPPVNDTIITHSMINNYVKLGIMPAPVKKKYSREHIAYLIIICCLIQLK